RWAPTRSPPSGQARTTLGAFHRLSSFFPRCAIDAGRHGGVDLQPLHGNILAAPDADPIFPLFHPAQGGVDALQFQLALTLRGKRHLLRLDRVNTGKTADTAMIDSNRAP